MLEGKEIVPCFSHLFTLTKELFWQIKCYFEAGLGTCCHGHELICFAESECRWNGMEDQLEASVNILAAPCDQTVNIGKWMIITDIQFRIQTKGRLF